MPTNAIFLGLVALVLAFLPNSPFTTVAESISNVPYLQYLNWFFPVTEAIAVFEVWLTAVLVYYVYQAIMRWVKVIG